MAILQKLPGLIVNVRVQDLVALQQYDDDDEESRKDDSITKYIEAQSGSAFSVTLDFDPMRFSDPEHCLEGRVYLDGKFAAGKYIKLKEIKKGERLTIAGVRSWNGSSWTFQNFTFAELQVEDGSARHDLLGKLTQLGEISVKLHWIRIETVPAPRATSSPSATSKPSKKLKPILEDGVVPEKNLKGRAISHQAKLGEAEHVPGLPPSTESGSDGTQRVMTRVGGNDPIATFTFKYRSRSALQALCIIPRSPSPIPLEDRDIDELNADELRELARLQKERLKSQADIKKELKIKKERKRERQSDDAEDRDDGDNVEIQDARPKKAVRTSFDSAVEIVDLSS